jgi:Ca-activated chloride channel family protein
MGMENVHWLRPLWLWALLLLPVWAWWAAHRARRASVWHGVVDAHLLPHLLAKDASPSRRRGRWLAAAAYTLAVIALAGPSWRQAAQPLWREHTPLVVALDLSSAADRRDLPPSRLAQARSKLATLLQQRVDGQVALVAYAGDAFTVAPLTDDAANVAVFLDALAPDVMPVDGQRIDRAISWSAKLLRQAGFTQGDILVMGDHATAADIAAAAAVASDGVRVSVLGLGAPAGAAASGGLDEASLRQLANAGRGEYRRVTGDDADLRALGVLSPRAGAGKEGQGGGGRQWLDEGYWLLPVLMLLVLPAFRRGVTVALFVLCVGWPLDAAQAADWWRRPDQVQHATMEAATQQYRRGEFEAAAQGFAQVDSADAHYNRGNALAKAGRYAEAIRAYDEALRRAPGMADARANRRAVQAAMQRKPPPGANEGAQGRPDAGTPAGTPNSADAGRPGSGEKGRPGATGSQGAPGPSPPASERARATPSAGADGTMPPSARVEPPDAAVQAKADDAQRARMQQALGQGRGQGADRQGRAAAGARHGETPAERERRIANEAWLRRVPDDPGGLLREKFRLEYQRRQQQGATSP